MKKENKGNNFINIVMEDGFVIIGVIGEFIVEDFLLFFEGNVGFLLKKIENFYWYIFNY